MERRKFLQRAGLVSAAAIAASVWPAGLVSAGQRASTADHMTAYGNSVCLGKGLGKGARPSQTWFEQTRRHFAVPGINGAVVGTTWLDSINTQKSYPERGPWLQIFWGGHADVMRGIVATIPNNVQTLVNYCTGPYLVMGTTNGHTGGRGTAYFDGVFTPVTGSNAKLAAAYPDNWLDVQQYLLTDALADAGITPTAQDDEYLANGQVPFSLLSPGAEVHLNLPGQTAVAQSLVIPFIEAKGWFA